MAKLVPISTWGLTVAPNVGLEEGIVVRDEPGTLQLTMAAINPGEEISKNDGVSDFKKPRATLLMTVVKEEPDDDDEEDDFDMDDLVGEDESDDEDGNGEGPSDPSKNPKEMKKAALLKALQEDNNDVLMKTKGKGKAAADVDMDMEDSEDSGEDTDLQDDAQTFVLCTLDPDSHLNQPLNISIPLREDVAFRVEGTHSIHLTGNILYNPADEPMDGPDALDSDEESDEEGVDLSPDVEELEASFDTESDELDDMDDPRITELDSEEDEKKKAPRLMKAAVDGTKGKNKRPAEDSLIEEKDGKPTADSILEKALKKRDSDEKTSEVNGDKPLSKSQLKKMRKKMKDNAGNAVQVKQELAGEDNGEKVTTEVKKDAPAAKAKSVQFAEKLVQGPGVNGASTKAHDVKDEKGDKIMEGKNAKAGKEGNKFNEPRTVDGVKVEDRINSSGNKGPQVKKGDRVSCRYIGKLEDKTEFDANRKGAPFKFKVGTGAVIKGMDIGVQGMTAGGERRITVPAHLAYGKKSLGKIPANSTLVFDIKLLEIN